MPKSGICKLTGTPGRFVRSHLIPAAFTKPEEPGAFLFQSGPGRRPVKRWSSWYDQQLVTEQGERILRDLDTWAIEELRRTKLVWSGWGPMMRLQTPDFRQIEGTPWGIRKLTVRDPAKLRLFFLSLLWRAAATEREEFSEVTLAREELIQLKEMVRTGNQEPLDFYPVQLTQLSTMGLSHNHTPIASQKNIPALGEAAAHTMPIFRFYFDGLIAHFHRSHAPPAPKPQQLGSLMVGFGSELALSTVTYEESFQRANLRELMDEVYATWGDILGSPPAI